MPKPSQIRLKETSKKQSIYLAMTVTGFEEKDGDVLVHGKSLASGATVVARLDKTDNKDRPTLEQLRDGKTQKNRTMEPGGVLCMDRAILGEDGVYTAHWPTVMAYDREAAKQVRCGMATVNVGETSEGHRYGNVILHSANPDNYILGDTPEALRSKAEAHAEKYASPTFTLRAVKDGNQVVSFGQILSSYNSAEKRQFTPKETGDRVVELATKLQQHFPGTTFNAVPGIRYSMSKFNLQRDEDFDRQQKFSTFYQARERDSETGAPVYLCRLTAFSTSKESDFVNTIKLLDPSTPGIEPIYLSDIIPAHDQRQELPTPNEAEEQTSATDTTEKVCDVAKTRTKTKRKAESVDSEAEIDPGPSF